MERELKATDKQKRLFLIAVIICFATILVYNFLTPIMSDDLSYATEVSRATGFGDLFRQELHQYNTWTGRSVAHITLRIFLFIGSKPFFNVISSLFFTMLTLLMYMNIEGRRLYNVRLYLFIVLSVWIFGVEFAQTILWETGACNYLFGAVYILLFMTLYKYYLKKGGCSVPRCIGMLILGVLAGWSNENTSGACVLFVLILLGFAFIHFKKVSGNGLSFVKPWMVTGLVGNIIGLALLVLAPGNSKRASLRDDASLSVSELAARFLQITKQQKEYFFWLLCAFIVIVFVLKFQRAEMLKREQNKKNIDQINHMNLNMLIFFALYLITAYVIILAPNPQGRVFFGAGLFLIIAVAQGLNNIKPTDAVIYAGRNGLVFIMLLYMGFTYVESGADLAWIKREINERYSYVQQKADEGELEITVPELRPQFTTRYSIAYESDIKEDKEYWTNGLIAGYYNVNWIYGVPRSEWTEY